MVSETIINIARDVLPPAQVEEHREQC
jgi:hypothetical protein